MIARSGVVWIAVITLATSMWRKTLKRMKSEPATVAALIAIAIRFQPNLSSTFLHNTESASSMRIL
jgi:hypothetical protein